MNINQCNLELLPLSRLSAPLFAELGNGFRDYQAIAIDAFIQFTCQKPYTNKPAVLWLGCGAGKSIIIAAIVHWITMKAPEKKCIATAPSIGLAKNNRRKYLETGNPAGFFCGSENSYNLNYPVTYGVINSFVNHLEQVLRYDIALLIIDEAHEKIEMQNVLIAAVLEKNPNCKIVKLSATPFTDKGWIFDNHYINGTEEQAAPEANATCIYQKTEADLIAEGYLTGYSVESFNLESYINAHEKITATGLSIEDYEDEDKLIACIALMIDQLRAEQHLKHGIAFLKTIPQGERAKKYFDILAAGEFRAECVHSKMDKKNRAKWIDNEHCDFRTGKINVVFNVAILTAGYDFPLSKYIWFLKQPTLNDFQQMIGRNTRLHEKKEKFLIYDFVGAIAKLELDPTDLFNPVVLAKFPKEKGDKIEIQCPQCQGKFKASPRPNPSKYGINAQGNFVDLNGKELDPPLSAHFARSCQVEKPLKPYPKSKSDYQYGCGYRFLAKDCPACGIDNDITASYCSACNQELINVNRDIQSAMATVSGDKLRLKVLRFWFSKELRQSEFTGGFYLPVGFNLEGLPEDTAVWLNPKQNELSAFKRNIPTHLTVKWSAKKNKWQVLEKVGDFIDKNIEEIKILLEKNKTSQLDGFEKIKLKLLLSGDLK